MTALGQKEHRRTTTHRLVFWLVTCLLVMFAEGPSWAADLSVLDDTSIAEPDKHAPSGVFETYVADPEDDLDPELIGLAGSRHSQRPPRDEGRGGHTRERRDARLILAFAPKQGPPHLVTP